MHGGHHRGRSAARAACDERCAGGAPGGCRTARACRARRRSTCACRSRRPRSRPCRPASPMSRRAPGGARGAARARRAVHHPISWQSPSTVVACDRLCSSAIMSRWACARAQTGSIRRLAVTLFSKPVIEPCSQTLQGPAACRRCCAATCWPPAGSARSAVASQSRRARPAARPWPCSGSARWGSWPPWLPGSWAPRRRAHPLTSGVALAILRTRAWAARCRGRSGQDSAQARARAPVRRKLSSGLLPGPAPAAQPGRSNAGVPVSTAQRQDCAFLLRVCPPPTGVRRRLDPKARKA